MPAVNGGGRRRLIIALDQDNFYVAVERILNPELRGKPVGITQKSLLATTSYEARAQGVAKLMSIRRAKEACPGLLLVDGEDLGKYRQYSTRVARLVNGLLGAEEGNGKGVEKLGLDEIFFDVTDLIYRHVDGLPEAIRAGSAPSEAQFSLPRAGNEDDSSPKSFGYPLLSFSGHIHPPEALDGSDFRILSNSSTGSDPVIKHPDIWIARNYSLLALSALSHLCDFIRSQIASQTGLSSSGGIAHSKLLAKLIGNQHKPNDQTTFIEMSDLEGTILAPMLGGMDRFVMDFLDPLSVRKINGFGHKTVDKIKEALVATPPLKAGQVEGDDVLLEDGRLEEDEELTVSALRAKTTLAQLEGIFGLRLGARLWQLLHGHDVDPVHPSPDFPKQISVEDSYALDMRRTFEVITRQMLELTILLLERLEEELVVVKPSAKQSCLRQWIRYPSLFRLQIRKEWEAPGGRDSKSTTLPAFIFDLQRPIMERAELLHKRVSLGLLRKLLNIDKADKNLAKKDFVVYVINVAVTNLQMEPPPPSLVAAWNRIERKSPPVKPQIDLTESPADELPYERPIGMNLDGEDMAWEEDLLEDDLDSVAMDNMVECGRCGERIFVFATTAHARYHEEPD